MPTEKLTVKFIDAIKAPSEGRIEYWDKATPGFGLRVSDSGRKTWVLMYRAGGVLRRYTLGTYPSLPLADARDKADDELRRVAKGIDPAAEKQAARKAETVAELVADYLDYAKREKRSWGKDNQILEKDVLPRFGKRKAHDIKRRDIIAMLDNIVARGAPIQANRTLAITRRLFNWAIEKDILEANPCYRVKKAASENTRDRVLTSDEIKSFWAALDSPDIKMDRGSALVLKLQLATAQRKGEVIAAEWSEFDLTGEKVWTIPAAKAKNGLAHRVPLSKLALDLLTEVKAEDELRRKKRAKRRKVALDTLPPSKWLFPSPRDGKPVGGQSIDHAMKRNRLALGIGEAVPHDLRRTAASHMTGMGINRLVVSKILNHVERTVTAVYDRHGYDAEKRHALDAWGARLEQIVTGAAAGDNVTEFRKQPA